MHELPRIEIATFLLVVLICIAAAVVGVLQLLSRGHKYKRLLSPLVCIAVVLEAILLMLRAVELKAVPLTGLFESMIVLTLVFGLIYVFLGTLIRQVWFGSAMVWVILGMVVIAGTVAEPASEPHAVAATPWAIAHGIAMVLGGALTAFATANAFLYLLGKRKLKQKKVTQVLGKVPNMEKLERMNLFGVRIAWVLITIGLISGLGLAVTKSQALGTTVFEWLTDAKIVLTAVVWALLALILVLRRMAVLASRTVACVTIAAFLLILYAIVGTSVFCGSQHKFSSSNTKATK